MKQIEKEQKKSRKMQKNQNTNSQLLTLKKRTTQPLKNH